MKNKISENKNLSELNESLNNQISALITSLNFTKKEVERLDNENTLLKNGENDKNYKISNFGKKLETLNDRLRKLEAENNSLKFNNGDLSAKLEMMAKSNEKNKKSNANDSPGKVESTSGNSNGKSSYHQLELKLREQSEEIKKLQLDIFELKKKLSEDEKIRNNLFDIIKFKKQKNKSLKFELIKVACEYEETGKENKWNHDLIMQRDIMIKIQKEKIEKLLNENKLINKQLIKYTGIKTADKGIETDNYDEYGYIIVKSSPTVFKPLN